jgi:D-alanine-D-alanine ligase
MGIPYSGSGILASAMGINKAVQKDFQTTAALYINDFATIHKSDWLNANEAQKKQWFVAFNIDFEEKFVIKPAHQGSSLGVSILKQPSFNEFCTAMDLAFFRLYIHQEEWNNTPLDEKIKQIKHLTDLRSGLGLPLIANENTFYLPNELLNFLDTHLAENDKVLLESTDSESLVLVESMIEGKEFSCIVIADAQGIPFALPPTEIRKSGDLFDYRSKYLPGLSNKVTPIEVQEEILTNIRFACCQLYNHFGFEVYARIDGFVNPDGEIFLNDPNTTSGMMPSSFFFHQAAEVGLNPSAFLTLIYFNSLRARIQSHPKGSVFHELLQRSEHLKLNVAGNNSSKKRIAVIMGGYSFERHISMESGRNIYEKLSSSPDFEPIPVFLAGNSQSYRLFQLPLNMMLKDNADDIRDKILNYNENNALNIIQTESERITKEYLRNRPVFKPEEISLETLSQICEGVFIALHGRPGEDGTIQEDLAKFGLYHNGSLSHSASITINKFETNRILREKGFLVANHAIVLKSDWQTKGLHLSQEICKEFGLPLIAKPADDGCSAAVRKIKSPEELNVYLSAIFRDTTHPSQEICSALNIRITDEMPQKNEILIEQFIDREGATRFLEVTGGMLTHFNENGQIQYEVFEPSESLAESEILSLEEKFLAGQGQNLTPSRFSNDPIEQNRISQAVRNTLESVAKALDVTGYCRIDAFVRIFENGQVETVIIEVNSLPGMTPATCIYHQASINGYKPFEFIREILKFGEKRIS